MLVNIQKLIYGGDGLARLPADEHGPGKAVFVPFVLEGETVEASIVEEKRGFVRARTGRIVHASAQRIEPQCPYFHKCGGCQYQHAKYEHQLEIKTAILKENLRRIAKLEIDEVNVVPSPQWNYRNRTRLKVQSRPEFALGYYRFNSHELLPVEQCPISSPLINEAIRALWDAGRRGEIASEIEEIEAFTDAADSGLLVECYCTSGFDRSKAAMAAEVIRAAIPQAVGVVMFESRSAQPAQLAHAGSRTIEYASWGGCYRVSAGAFFQANRFLIDELTSLVTGSCAGENALDLYAGVGLFTVPLARSFAQVIAVESSPTSFADLQYNSPPNVKAVQARTEHSLERTAGERKLDLVVIDPPRGGLGEIVVRRLAALNAPAVIYVSCDPATLARDLGGLCASGFRIERAHMVDLFPQTYHLESVIRLAR